MIFEVDALLTEYLDDSYFIAEKKDFIRDVLLDYISNDKDDQFIVQSLGHLLGEHLSILQVSLFMDQAKEMKKQFSSGKR